MNVPKLRFKEFNDEWQNKKIDELFKLSSGSTPATTEKNNYVGDINWISSGELKSKYINKTINCISKKVSKSMMIYPKGTLLIALYGLEAEGVRGTASILNIDSTISQACMAFEPLNNNITNEFMYYWYKKNGEWIGRKIAQGTKQQNLTSELVKPLIVNYPQIIEQNKIEKMLSLLDRKIEFQSKKIEDLKLFKKGLINSIGKNIEIEKIPLKNILAEQNHKTIKNNEYEILSSTSKGIYLQKDYFNKQAASDNNVGYKILKKNQLVLSPQNLWMGNININSKYNIGIVSPSYKIFDINNNIDIDFFDYWIKSPKALYEYKISSEQGASIVRRNLNMDLFYEIKVDIPKGKMQNKLGKIIKLLNLKIQYNENSLQKLQELKKGLMQNMFV